MDIRKIFLEEKKTVLLDLDTLIKSNLARTVTLSEN